MYCQHVIINKAHMLMPNFMTMVTIAALYVALYRGWHSSRRQDILMIRNETIHPIEWSNIRPRKNDPKPPHSTARAKTNTPSVIPVTSPVLAAMPDVSPTRLLFKPVRNQQPPRPNSPGSHEAPFGHRASNAHHSTNNHKRISFTKLSGDDVPQSMSSKKAKAMASVVECTSCSGLRRALLASYSTSGSDDQNVHISHAERPNDLITTVPETSTRGADDDAAVDAEGATQWWASIVPELTVARVPLAGKAALLLVQPPETGGSALDAIFTYLENAATKATTTNQSARLLSASKQEGSDSDREGGGDLGRDRLLCTRRVIADHPDYRPKDLAIGCGGPARGAGRTTTSASIYHRSREGSSRRSGGSDVMVEETPEGGNDIIVGSFPLDFRQAQQLWLAGRQRAVWALLLREPLARVTAFARRADPHNSLAALHRTPWRFACNQQTSLVNGVPGSGAGCGVGIDHAAVARARTTTYHTNGVSPAVDAGNHTLRTGTTPGTHPLWRAFSFVPGACAHSPANAIATAFRRLEGPAVTGFSSLPHFHENLNESTTAAPVPPSFAFVGVFEDLLGSAFLMQRALGWDAASLRAAFSTSSKSSPAGDLPKHHANEKLNPKTRCTIEASESRCDELLWQRATALLKARLKAMPYDDQIALEVLRNQATASGGSSGTSRSSSSIVGSSSFVGSAAPISSSTAIGAPLSSRSEAIMAQDHDRIAGPVDHSSSQEEDNPSACSGMAAAGQEAKLERHTDDGGHGDVCRIPSTGGFACPKISIATKLPSLGPSAAGKLDKSGNNLPSYDAAACVRVLRKPFCVMPNVDPKLDGETELPCRVGKPSQWNDAERAQEDTELTTLPPNVIRDAKPDMNSSPTPAAVAAVRGSYGVNLAVASPPTAAFEEPAEAGTHEDNVEPESAPREVHEESPHISPSVHSSKPQLRNGNKFFGGFFFSD